MDNLPAGFQLDSSSSALPEGTSSNLPPGFELNEDKYGGVTGAIKTFAMGAADNATLGLSNLALTKTGFANPETLKGLEEENPGSHFAGELVGALAPVGPASWIGKAGKGIYEAKQAINIAKDLKLAREVTTAGKLLNAAEKVGYNAVGSAVEGALYSGVGNTINEYALGDPELNAQKILGHMGQGALWGGAVGGALHAAAIGIPPSVLAAKEGISKLRDTLIGTGEKDAGLVGKIFPESKMADALANRISDLDNDGTQFIKGAAKDLSEVNKNVQSAIEDLNKNVRPKETDALIETANPQAAKEAHQQVLYTLSSAVETMKKAPEMFQATARNKLDAMHTRLVDVLEDQDPKKIFNTLRDIKQELGTAVFTKVPTETGQATQDLLKPISSLINNTLKNPDIFGMAGAALASHDEMLSKYYGFISPNGSRPTQFQKAFGSVTKRAGSAKWEFDESKLASVFKRAESTNPSTKLKAEGQLKLLEDYWSVLKEMPEHLENTYATVPSNKFKPEDLKSIIDSTQGNVLKNKEELAGLSKRIAGSKDAVGFRDLLAGGVAAHNPIAGAAIEMYNVWQNPYAKMRKLGEMERMIAKSDNAVSMKAKSIFTEALRTTGKAKGALAKEMGKTTPEEYKKRAQEITEMSGNPQLMMDKLNKSTQAMYDAAPSTAQGTQSAMIRANQFLASKLPPQSQGPFSEAPEPSNTEIAQFDRYRHIVENPISALEEVKRGTLTPETIETLLGVYPALFNHMKQTVLKHAVDMKSKKQAIPFRVKQSVSMFLGQPLDESLMPQSIAANQASFQSVAPQEQGSTKPSTVGMREMNTADRYSLASLDDNGE